MKLPKRATYFLLGFLLLVSAYFYCQGKSERVLATVGSYSITEKHVELRDRVLRKYNPEEKNSYGFDQLVRAYTYAEILRLHGRPVTEEILKAESLRIDEKTLRPELLAHIKNVFSGDEALYRNIFVLPVYVERVLYYDFFLNDPEAQHPSLSKASNFLNEVKKVPTHFEKEAKARNIASGYFIVSPKTGILPLKKERAFAEAPSMDSAPPQVIQKMKEQSDSMNQTEGAQWINDLLKPLKKGQVHPQVINQGETWAVILNGGPEKEGSYKIQMASIPKDNFSLWLEEEKKKVPFKRF